MSKEDTETGSSERWDGIPRWSRYLSEFLGTFVLVLVILWIDRSAIPYGPFIIFTVLTAIIYGGAYHSKSQFNVCATISLIGRKSILQSDFLAFLTSIILGGIIATWVSHFIPAIEQEIAPSPELYLIVVSEFIGTFALCWVIMHVATLARTEGNKHYGISIAGTVLIGILLLSYFGTTFFNPSVALAFWMTDKIGTAVLITAVTTELIAAFIAMSTFNRFYRPSAK